MNHTRSPRFAYYCTTRRERGGLRSEGYGIVERRVVCTFCCCAFYAKDIIIIIMSIQVPLHIGYYGIDEFGGFNKTALTVLNFPIFTVSCSMVWLELYKLKYK